MKDLHFLAFGLLVLITACNSQPAIPGISERENPIKGNWVIADIEPLATSNGRQNAALAVLAATDELPQKVCITKDSIILSTTQGDVQSVQYEIISGKSAGKISVLENGNKKAGEFKLSGDKLSLAVDGVVYKLQKYSIR